MFVVGECDTLDGKVDQEFKFLRVGQFGWIKVGDVHFADVFTLRIGVAVLLFFETQTKGVEPYPGQFRFFESFLELL